MVLDPETYRNHKNLIHRGRTGIDCPVCQEHIAHRTFEVAPKPAPGWPVFTAAYHPKSRIVINPRNVIDLEDDGELGTIIRTTGPTAYVSEPLEVAAERLAAAQRGMR